MWFALLGPLQVTHGDGEFPVPASRQRVLLAALLTQAGQPVPVEELAELVWDGHPPSGAQITLRSYVKRLRQALGPAIAARIVTRPPGYLLEASDDEVDLRRFTALCQAGDAAMKSSAWPRACDLLNQALGLWRGAPLADIPSQLLQDREVPQLERWRMSATELRIDAELHLGHHDRLIPELQALTAAHPLHERFYGQLMSALHGTGQRATALAVYRQARRTVVGELGIEPSAELRDLNRRIIDGDPGLTVSPAVSPSGQPVTLAVPMQLPSAVRQFTGREAELARLTARLDEGATAAAAVTVLAIDGPAGVGKTALAVHWAYRVADRFPDGQLYVDLHGFDQSGQPVTPSAAIRGFFDAFAIPPDRIPVTLDAQAALYRTLLAGKRVLLILDNASDAAQVLPLLPGSPGCAVVVTSRAQLAPLMATGGAHLLTLEVLPGGAARDLLTSHIEAVRLAAEPRAADSLIELCAGLPLALRIVAARISINPAFPLAAFVTGLEDAHGRLDALDMGEASSSVRAAFSWSYNQLSDLAARAFRLLSLHPGPDVTLPAAASLLGLPQALAGRAMDELIRAHLLAEHAPGRYAGHDLVRAYAVTQARAIDTGTARREAGLRLLDYYLHTGYACALLINPARDPMTLAPAAPGVTLTRPDTTATALAWFEAEYRAMLAAAAFAAANGFDGHAWRIPWTLSDFFAYRGYRHQWVAAQELAVAAAAGLGDDTAQAHTRRSLGRACTEIGDYRQAGEHLTAAMVLYRKVHDRGGEALTRLALSRIFEAQQDYRRAAEQARSALGLYREIGHVNGEARALNGVGWCHAHLGDHTEALRSCEQALEIYLRLGDKRGQAVALDSLGYVQHQLGDYSRSQGCYQQALSRYDELGDRYYQADTLSRLGDCHRAAGHGEDARETWRAALAILAELDRPEADQVRAKLEELGRQGAAVGSGHLSNNGGARRDVRGHSDGQERLSGATCLR
jgi:DNA-binding SARP family transcriptional activator/tetratricopeptide (TPR) repeat protein